MITLISIILSLGISWAVVTGVVWLICWCFSLQFSLLIATGIWAVLILLKFIFGK